MTGLVFRVLRFSVPCCSSFGTKAVDPKPIMKALPALFGHTQAGVRDKAKEVSVELCAYLGQVGVTLELLLPVCFLSMPHCM